MDFFVENWQWITENPLGFLMTAVVFAGLGWKAAKVIYHERVELHKAQAEQRKPEKVAPINQPQAFAYDAQGRHGRNLLASSTHDAKVGEEMSLQASIPEGSKLHIALSGPPPQTLSETMAAWSFSVMGVVNWTQSKYQESTNGSTQHFNAEGGRADLQFTFHRPGRITIEAFEGESKVATWSKRVHVG